MSAITEESTYNAAMDAIRDRVISELHGDYWQNDQLERLEREDLPNLIRLFDGRLAVLVHKKTTADISADSAYWRNLRCDLETGMHVLDARQKGYSLDTVLYDVTHKPGLRPCQVPLKDTEGFKIVLDENGERVRSTQDESKWRESGNQSLGYVLQTRPETPEEYGRRIYEAICEDPMRYFRREEVLYLDAIKSIA